MTRKDDAAALDEFFDERETAAADESGDEPTPDGHATFEVVGPHRVHGKSRGQTLDLDPDAAQTRFLVDVGHIRPVTGTDNQED